VDAKQTGRCKLLRKFFGRGVSIRPLPVRRKDAPIRGTDHWRPTMEYMILIYNDERSYGSATEAQLKAMYQEYGAYTQDLIKAGVMKGGSELKPVATATTVRIRGGKVLTTDGPFAETKEQLGGYYLIDVPNLDEAVKWGSKCPGAKTGSIEVRPLNPHS
jgi:hypothetical protein